MLDDILLTKVSYDTDIPATILRYTPKFWDYWLDYLSSPDENWRLVDVVDFAMEMRFNGEFQLEEDNK
jgi:protein associated with RNAse G/E